MLWIYIQGRVLLMIPEILVDYPSQLNLQTKMTYLDEVCNSKYNGYQTDAGVKIKGTLKIGYGFLCHFPFVKTDPYALFKESVKKSCNLNVQNQEEWGQRLSEEC